MERYFIAEIGFNHEGDMGSAIEMVRAAAEAGASAVKFQSFRAGDILLPSSPYYDGLKEGELSPEQHQKLFEVARECGVDFLSTPFGPWAVELLEKIGVPAYKVASMDCTNKHLLSYIAQTGKPIYLSTGMATVDEIGETLAFLAEAKSGPVTLLHCMSLYPAAQDDLNLEIIPYLQQVFEVPVGYSDHYPGTQACLAASMLGATVIETHFTLDSSKEGGDHSHSVEPAALKKLVEDIALLDTMRGDGRKIFTRPDRHYAKDYRRGLYAAREIKEGQQISENDLQLCRPESELSPNDLKNLDGKKVKTNVAAYSAIEASYISC